MICINLYIVCNTVRCSMLGNLFDILMCRVDYSWGFSLDWLIGLIIYDTRSFSGPNKVLRGSLKKCLRQTHMRDLFKWMFRLNINWVENLAALCPCFCLPVGAEECVLKKYGRWLLDHIQYPISWSPFTALQFKEGIQKPDSTWCNLMLF